MFDAYKVAIKLTLVNHATTGLLAISKSMQGLHKETEKAQSSLTLLEKKLLDIQRTGLIGGALAGVGFGGLMLFKGPIEEAIQWEKEVAKLRQMGLGNAEILDAQKFASATDIIGTSMQQRMKLFVEAQGAFRESGMSGPHALEAAKTMMPVLAAYESASATLTGDKHAAAENAMRNLSKTVEMMGGLGDVNKATAITDGVFKAVQSSGKMVDERQLKQFVAYASSAGNQLSPRTIFGGLEPIIGELGGSSTAVGLRTAYTRVNGMMSLPPKLMLHEMHRLGMADKTGKKQTDALAKLESTDVIAYAREIMQRYEAHGIKTQTDRERENARLFGTTGSKVFNKIMAQLPVIEKSLESYDKSHGIKQTLEDNANSPMTAIQNFNAAMKDLKLTIGKDVLPVLTPMIEGITAFFKELGKQPSLVKTLTYGFVGLAASMAISGTVLLATSGLKGMRTAMELLGASGGVIGTTTNAVGKFGKAIGALGALATAWELGQAAGGLINDYVLSDGAKDSMGRSIATLLALFGNKDARAALDAEDGAGIGPKLANKEDPNGYYARQQKNFLPPKPSTQSAINNTIVMPNGEVLARVVTKAQSKQLARQPTGPRAVDPTMSLFPVAASLGY